MNAVLPAFSGYGVELEYMVVDRSDLAIMPIADKLLLNSSGEQASEVKYGPLAWSNEIMLHVLELKNVDPVPSLESLPGLFQKEVQRMNDALKPMGAMLMPSAMHPWMNPRVEAKLWPHDNAEIYRTYDRIFNCKRHGWANLQSMHLNLSFADDLEFAQLHAAIRLLLPILPALAASSPIADNGYTGFVDFRIENYFTHQLKIPTTMGSVIPDTVTNRASYEAQVLAPMYREIAGQDPDGELQHEWLNVRGAVPRFDRHAIEIRILDVQECPSADFAIAAVVNDIVHALYEQRTAPLADQQMISTDALVKIMRDCAREGEQALITDREYLELMGFSVRHCEARELWQHLITSEASGQTMQQKNGQDILVAILEHGPLARRILRAVNQDYSRERLQTVYRELCRCLNEGRLFLGVH